MAVTSDPRWTSACPDSARGIRRCRGRGAVVGANPHDIELRRDQSTHMVSAVGIDRHELADALAHVAIQSAAVLVEGGLELSLQSHLQALAQGAEGAVEHRDREPRRVADFAVDFNGCGDRHGQLQDRWCGGW